MAGLGRKVFTRERATVADVQGYLMDQSVMVFASASARNAAIPSSAASAGMVTYLSDSKVYEEYINGAWRRRNGRVTAGYPAGTLVGTNNLTLASVVVNPGRPYKVTVHASGVFTPGSGSSGSLRIFESAPTPGQVRNAGVLNQTSQSADISRSYEVPDGASRTYYANLEVLAGAITYYTDERHSFIEAMWEAL